MQIVTIDLVPIRVGEGGTGSGIWTYARELLHAMDAVDLRGLDVVVLVNAGQLPYLSDLQNIRLIRFPTFGKNVVMRVLWVHAMLPLVCLFFRFNVLHKLATETPLFCPAKRVTTVHDFYYEFLLENHPPEKIRLYERLENFYFSLTTRTCFGKSRAIIAVSEATKQEAVRRYPEADERIHVIHHGAPEDVVDLDDRERAQGTQRQGLSKAQSLKPKAFFFKILCVAKFMEHKGQHLLINAFENLLMGKLNLVEWVKLDLRGFHNDGDYFEMVSRKIAESRFSKNIHLVPYCADEGLEEMYADVDLVVLLSSYEGFGLPVLEAQGFGIPVLCSDLPVLQEVGGAGAVYVDREDVPSIARAIRRFIDDPDYCEEMKTKALNNIDRFSWGKAAEQTVEVYRNI